MILALIPAHDEAERLPGTIAALRNGSRQPDWVIVVNDRSEDDTHAVAAEHADAVYDIVVNDHRKAGALNQALRTLLPGLSDDDLVLVQDADSPLCAEWIEVAEKKIRSDEKIGAVGAVFYGEAGGGFLGLLQRSEFTRYARELRRTDRVKVLSGTGALFRVKAIREVIAERAKKNGLLPHHTTDFTFYNRDAITEDNEITLALKSLGWELSSPKQCSVETEVMPTLKRLWVQRRRWQRGAIDNLKDYGWTPVTRRYILKQMGMGLSVLALTLYLVFTASLFAVHTHWVLNPFWLGIGVLFVVERVVTVWRAGWRNRLVAVLILPELVYDGIQHAVYVTCLLAALRGTRQKWSTDTQ